MAGDAFIEGSYFVASYPTRNPFTYVLDKHTEPIFDPGGSGTEPMAGVRLTRYGSVDWLNDPLFTYLDWEYYGWLTLAEPVAVGLHLGLVTPALLFRASTEFVRQHLGEALDVIDEHLDVNIAPGSVAVDVRAPDITVGIAGIFQLKSRSVSFRAVAGTTPSFRMQGRFDVVGLGGVTGSADFAGDNFIEVDQNGLHIRGDLSLSDAAIVPGFFEVRSATLRVDTDAGLLRGNAALVMPGGTELSQASVELRFRDWKQAAGRGKMARQAERIGHPGRRQF